MEVLSGAFNLPVTVTSVENAPDTSTRRSGSSGVEVTVLISNVDPKDLSALVNDKMQQQVQKAVMGLTPQKKFVVTVSQPIIEMSPSAASCGPGYFLNQYTENCCSSEASLPSEGTDPVKMVWTNSCSWTCLPPYVLWDLSCLTCSERNALVSDRSKPANSSWDNTGASPDCSAWICNAGYLLSTNSEACVQYDDLLHTCASYTRCATCSLGPGCVWCNTGGCVPGIMHPLNGSVCAYSESGSPNCSCGAVGCPQECKGHHSCELCMGDSLCGWCEGTGGCLLDIQALPPQAATVVAVTSSSSSCPAYWLAHGSVPTLCPTQSSNLPLVLISTFLGIGIFVTGLAFFAILVRCGFFGPHQTGSRRAALPSRLLAELPTFKYGGQARNMRCTESTHEDGLDSGPEEGQEGCSICLAEFAEGEELRMLCCLHVFHRHCVDRWLAISRECPLCKHDLSAAVASPPLLASAAFAARQGRSYDVSVLSSGRRRMWMCRCFHSAVVSGLESNVTSSALSSSVPIEGTGAALLMRPTLLPREQQRQLMSEAGGDRLPATATSTVVLVPLLSEFVAFSDSLDGSGHPSAASEAAAGIWGERSTGGNEPLVVGIDRVATDTREHSELLSSAISLFHRGSVAAANEEHEMEIADAQAVNTGSDNMEENGQP